MSHNVSTSYFHCSQERNSLTPSKTKKSINNESILQHFDRLITEHLEMRKSNAPVIQRPSDSYARTLTTSMSKVDIVEELNVPGNNELIEAAEHLIKAEEDARFAEKLAAAKAAVAAVPPEMAEEAALAAGQSYRTETIGMIKKEIPGDIMIEVLGYVGITKPKENKNLSPFCICR